MSATLRFLAVSAMSFAAPASFAQSSYWDGPGPWHMLGWGGWGFGFWWVFPLLMVVLMIGLCAFFMSRMFGGHSPAGDAASSALRLLSERFAKGEISEEEFEEKRAVLGGRP